MYLSLSYNVRHNITRENLKMLRAPRPQRPITEKQSRRLSDDPCYCFHGFWFITLPACIPPPFFFYTAFVRIYKYIDQLWRCNLIFTNRWDCAIVFLSWLICPNFKIAVLLVKGAADKRQVQKQGFPQFHKTGNWWRVVVIIESISVWLLYGAQ